MSCLHEVVDAVVVCMSRHDSNPRVFSKGCAVLWKMAHTVEAVKVRDWSKFWLLSHHSKLLLLLILVLSKLTSWF